MGIDVGPMLLAIDNYRSGMIWQLTARNPQLAAGMNAVFGPASVEKVKLTAPEN